MQALSVRCLSSRLWTSADGNFGVDRIALPRVYHVNLVLQLKGTDLDANEDATVLQKCVQGLWNSHYLHKVSSFHTYED